VFLTNKEDYEAAMQAEPGKPVYVLWYLAGEG